MDKIDALAGEVGHQMGPSRVGVPTDALLRGLVTIADVELAFTLFVVPPRLACLSTPLTASPASSNEFNPGLMLSRLSGSACVWSCSKCADSSWNSCNATDRVPLSLRAKSPFLFHAILLVTNC